MRIDSGGVIQIEDGMIVTKNDGSSTNAYMSIGHDASYGQIGAGESGIWGVNNNDMIFGTNDTLRMTIEATGKIETTTGVNDWLAELANSHGSGAYGLKIKYTGYAPDGDSNDFISCSDTGATRFQVQSDGDMIADGVTIASDESLKTNIVDATSKLEDINKLKVRNFEWIPEYHPNKVGEKKIGFIAQEFEEVFPSIVREIDSPITSEAEKGIKTKTIGSGALIPILVKAVQELTAKVEALENA